MQVDRTSVLFSPPFFPLLNMQMQTPPRYHRHNPLFSRPAPPAKPQIIFCTTSRGHHTDIGGILPGSMPPTSTSIYQEGAIVESFKIVSQGIFDGDGLYDVMVTKPSKWPGGSGCRCFKAVSFVVLISPHYVDKILCGLANRCESQRHTAYPCS